jgi:hypothetical protein
VSGLRKIKQQFGPGLSAQCDAAPVPVVMVEEHGIGGG